MSRPVGGILSPASAGRGGHPSERSTWGHSADGPAVPRLTLLRVGFTKPPGHPGRWCALTAPFHPYLWPWRRCPSAVCFLWHFPAGRPDWPLASTLPCGVPTFLDQVAVPVPGPTPDRDHPAGSLLASVAERVMVTTACSMGGCLHCRPSLALHPAVAAWFDDRFPEGPTEPQAQGWPLVQGGSDVLIAAPTGSGKTLAGFLMAIDDAYRAHESGVRLAGRHQGRLRLAPQGAGRRRAPEPGASPGRDSRIAPRAKPHAGPGNGGRPYRGHSFERPVGHGQGPADHPCNHAREPLPLPDRRTQPGNLDGGPYRHRGRDPRPRPGTSAAPHLTLSLERLEHVQQGAAPQRVGLSATQRPIEVTARLLSGAGATTRVAVLSAPVVTAPTVAPTVAPPSPLPRLPCPPFPHPTALAFRRALATSK